MIRTVSIPTTVPRMGCAPGGDCCSDCKGHKTGALTGTHTNRIAAADRGMRNIALRSHLGDIYTDAGVDPTYTGTQYSTSPPGAVYAPTPTSSSNFLGLSSTTMMYALGALGVIALIELTGGRRR